MGRKALEREQDTLMSIKKNKLKIVYCPSDIMIADYMTKPLVGS